MWNKLNMKNYFISAVALIVAAFNSVPAFSQVREWKDDPNGLPYYKCSGVYEGDPAILLGNNRIKVNTYMSGKYQLISGERCWATFNADPSRPEMGKNRATAYIGSKPMELVGESSLATTPGRCEVYSGAGFVRYDYDLGNGIKCSRMISLMPSSTPESGEPYFLVTVTFTNQGSSAKSISYDEAISPYYVQAEYLNVPDEDRPFSYAMSTEITFRCIKNSYIPVPQNFAVLPAPEYRSMDEVAPQPIFLYCDNAFLAVNEGELKASVNSFRLRSGKTRTFHIVIGFAGENNRETAEMAIAKAEDSLNGVFASMWKKNIPDFSKDVKADLRNELYRSAYAIEASAVYNDYFKEAYISGKLPYWGNSGNGSSNSDHINAALQACQTDPVLAKSVIRYIMKQTSYDGMLPDRVDGYGYIRSDAYSHNLMQLELFNVLAEYLKHTGDYAFLDEWINIYPLERGEVRTVKSLLESYFIYIRNISITGGASAKMDAMQAAYLPEFVKQMELSGKVSSEFLQALQKYAQKSIEKFAQRKQFTSDELPYLLETEALSISAKRDYLEDAVENNTLDIRAVPGITTFDSIDANSLFRKLMSSGNWDDSNASYAWALYSYLRLKE